MYKLKKRNRFIKWLAAVSIFAGFITSCTPKQSEIVSDTKSDIENKILADRETDKDLNESIDSAVKEYSRLFLLETMALKDLDNQLYKSFDKETLTGKTILIDKLYKDFSDYDIDKLEDENMLVKLILDEYMSRQNTEDELWLYYEPFDLSNGIQKKYPLILLNYQINTKEDIENYLALLENIDEYFQKAIDFENKKVQSSLFMSDEMADKVIASCDNYLLSPNNSFLEISFKEKLDSVQEISEQEKKEFIAKNLKCLQTDYVKAYDIIRSGISDLKVSRVSSGGIYNADKGKEYYEYLIYHNIGILYETMDDLIYAIERSIGEDVKEISELMPESGIYSQDVFSGFDYEDIYSILENKEFDYGNYPKVENEFHLRDVPEGLENTLEPVIYMDGTVYINKKKANGLDGYNALLEKVLLGQMYLNAYQKQNGLSDIRRVLSFEGYKNAWSTYVKLNSFDESKEDNNLKLLLKREALQLGIYAYLDIRINYKGADKEEVFNYLEKYYRIKNAELLDDIYNTVTESPAKYLIDYIGYMEISNMKEEAENALKERFNESEFHKFILDIGPAPFSIIRKYFNAWLILR